MRVVILGTGTNVGKTYFTVRLAQALGAAEPALAVAALKPIESGFNRIGSDVEALEATARHTPLPSQHPLIGLPDPVSPHLAARLAARPPITLEEVQAWLNAWESSRSNQNADDVSGSAMPRHATSRHVTLIETAGGCFSPLAPGIVNLDLAEALKPAIQILVAHDGLGVLHDVTACLTAMKSRGFSCDYLVLTAARPPDASTGTNADELAHLGIAHPAAVLGRDRSDLEAFARRLLIDHVI